MTSFRIHALSGLLFLSFGFSSVVRAQTEIPISVDTKLVLDAAGPEQRNSLNAIYMIVCPGTAGVAIGSGFLLDSGIVVTNVHVVGTCTEANLFAISTTSKRVNFSRIVRDGVRDLALLVPAERLSGGLKLATTDNPAPGVTVSTWGYPFAYNGVSPLLSVGYVAGYRNDTLSGRDVKHIIVNGAFNHGNSGGPLLMSHDNQVIGVVVLTYNFYPQEVKDIIETLSKNQVGVTFKATYPDGKVENMSESQIVARVLDEFYQKTQVMIGEAVAVAELRAMISEHSSDLHAAH